jgi:hypothetical protein
LRTRATPETLAASPQIGECIFHAAASMTAAESADIADASLRETS